MGTAEGQPYLLETQAADLRQRILNATSRALAAYADLGIARQWAGELDRRIAAMNAAIAEEEQARSRLSEARRAVGGAAQARVDALAAQREQQERELSRHAAQAERLTQRAVRAWARGNWPLLGLLFGMLARRSEQRLSRIQEAATRLRADRDSTQRALARAEQELDAVTRDDPAVQAASATVTQLSDRRAEGRDSALAAARACRDLVARVDVPVFVAEKARMWNGNCQASRPGWRSGCRCAAEMGRNRVHELNREHLGAPVAGLLADLRLELWNRFRKTLGTWNPKPVYGCVFGSAARGDGDAESDIDLLLVHAPLPGEEDPRRRSGGLDAVAGSAAEFTTVQLTDRQLARWQRQVDQLRGLVRGWTGNPLQVLEMSTFLWADQQRRQSALFVEISRDAVEVVGGSS